MIDMVVFKMIQCIINNWQYCKSRHVVELTYRVLELSFFQPLDDIITRGAIMGVLLTLEYDVIVC